MNLVYITYVVASKVATHTIYTRLNREERFLKHIEYIGLDMFCWLQCAYLLRSVLLFKFAIKNSLRLLDLAYINFTPYFSIV